MTSAAEPETESTAMDERKAALSVTIFDDGDEWAAEVHLVEAYVADVCGLAGMAHEAIDSLHRRAHIDEVVAEILDESRN